MRNQPKLYKSQGRSFKAILRELRPALALYGDTRKLLRGSISRRSRLGLDWMNFFLADVQTGFGAFVAFYLAEVGLQKSEAGLALLSPP